MEYDAKELLNALPLVKDVTPSHLHTYRTRDGLVSVNGDLSAARPVLADARMDLDGVFIPLGKVRRLLQLWPAGERVEVYVGSYCPLQVRRDRYGGVRYERTKARRFVQFTGRRFRCRLDDAERYDYRMSKGDWRWTSREENIRHAESAAYHEEWCRRIGRLNRASEAEREVLNALVARKLGRAA